MPLSRNRPDQDDSQIMNLSDTPAPEGVQLPAVSVIVPCRNEYSTITACLTSILQQEPPPGGFEVIIADGASNDGTRELVARLAACQSRLRVIDNPSQIVSAGLNAGIRVARGQIIIRMDAHTRYAPDYLCQCVGVLKTSTADNVGGPWIAKGEGYWGRAIAAAFQSPFAVGGARGHDPDYEGLVDTVYLGCWRRDVFDRIGFFDEELVRNQDDEFNLRLIRAGGKVWQSPKIQSWYAPRNSLKTLWRQYLQYGYWKVRVMKKHRLPASWRHVVPACFVSCVFLLTVLSLWSSAAASVLLGLMISYCVCVVLASVATASSRGWELLPILPAVFACFHWSYAYGFLYGIWDFVLVGRKPSMSKTALTRDPS